MHNEKAAVRRPFPFVRSAGRVCLEVEMLPLPGEGKSPPKARVSRIVNIDYRKSATVQVLALINVDLPNRLSTRSTARRAVRLWSSKAGFSSTTSSEASRPVSAIISMHSWASR
ncbi:MAG: hypothetical protein OMOMHJEC_03209 [Xanthomonadales bacterium]|nr:hypothetical protein [Xanthomonadales bacterium]